MNDNDIQIGDKIIGEKTKISLNLKTFVIIMGVLYAILCWFYWDLRQELKSAVEISKDEKNKFLKEVDDEFDSKLDQIKELTTSIRIDQATMQGDIKIILDRNQRGDEIHKPTNSAIQPIKPPGSN